MASRLMDQGHGLEALQLTLGHASRACRPHLQVDKKKLRQAFAEVL